MNCLRCGSTNPEGKRFCGECGAPLVRRCGACGSENPPGNRFCADCGAPLLDGAAAEPASTTPFAAPPSSAERRQLTVLFCDLVGSTELAGRLDPEDLHEVIGAYQRCVAAVVERWAGHVAKFMGDGVLAFFGYPQAHEDDAERAVRAGLELADTVAQLHAADGRAAARIGIATGPVVVGDLIGTGEAQERGVVGETPNLAARLQSIAEPHGVLIGSGTRRLVAGVFDLADLGPQQLKGFASPVPAWRVLGVSQVAGRFEARQTGGVTPLVGRDGELGLLLSRWEQARDGEGQIVLLCGEPGLGKSRLVRALRDRLGQESYTSLQYQSSPHHTNSALYPVVSQLERAAGIRADDAREAKLAKLEGLLGQGTDDVAAIAPLFADLLAIPTDGRYPPLHLTPQRRKDRQLGALLDQLAGLAARHPVVLLFEDAHWMDPTTAELVGRLIERVRELPVLLLVTFRPELVPPWTGQAHVTFLTLNRLGGRQVAAMVERIAGKPLPAEVVEQIAARTDGVPLFVEEMTKAVLESGLLRDEEQRYALAGPLLPLAVPATLQDSLMARLDASPGAKEVAQIAAAIGREFSHELLAAVAALAENRLQEAMAQLIESELVFRRSLPLAVGYVFKHALVQDAAYQSLLRAKRQDLHARIVAALEERFPNTADKEPELLAHHCEQAKLTEKAVAYRLGAGRQAIARSAMAEAVAQLSAGLEALGILPDTPERRTRELDLQAALGSALLPTKGNTAPEVGRAFARARELCRDEKDLHRVLPVLNGQLLFHFQRRETKEAHAIAQEMLHRAQRQGDPALLISAHRAMSHMSVTSERYSEARDHGEQVLALYDAAQHRSLASLYSFDQRTQALGFLSWALFALGYHDQARLRSQEAAVEARALAHPNSITHALSVAANFQFLVGDVPATLQAAEACIRAAVEHDLPYYVTWGKVLRGAALVRQGAIADGLRDLDEVAPAIAGTVLGHAASGVIAEAHARSGRPEEARRWAAAAPGWAENPTSWFATDQLRRAGELLLMLPEPDRDEAEAFFQRALDIAQTRKAKMWELRAAVSLAGLWRDQGKRREALGLLSPIYGWFTEGFGTPDLQEARALLHELR